MSGLRVCTGASPALRGVARARAFGGRGALRRRVSAEHPRGTRGEPSPRNGHAAPAAAPRTESMWHPRTRPRGTFVHAAPVAATVPAEYPRGTRGAAATRHGISTQHPRCRRDLHGVAPNRTVARATAVPPADDPTAAIPRGLALAVGQRHQPGSSRRRLPPKARSARRRRLDAVSSVLFSKNGRRHEPRDRRRHGEKPWMLEGAWAQAMLRDVKLTALRKRAPQTSRPRVASLIGSDYRRSKKRKNTPSRTRSDEQVNNTTVKRREARERRKISPPRRARKARERKKSASRGEHAVVERPLS